MFYSFFFIIRWWLESIPFKLETKALRIINLYLLREITYKIIFSLFLYLKLKETIIIETVLILWRNTSIEAVYRINPCSTLILILWIQKSFL